MINDSPSFSVNLARRASVQGRVRLEAAKGPTHHYNLKRLSQDFSQLSSSASSNNGLWYGKASENYEVQLLNSLPARRNSSALHRRLSQIITPSTKLWREDGRALEESLTSRQDTSCPILGRRDHDSYPYDTTITRPISSRVSLKRMTWNLPNTRFCVAKDHVEISYLNHQPITYPQLPLPRLTECARRSSIDSSSIDLEPLESSRLSISSIYSINTESSFTLELTNEFVVSPGRHFSMSRPIEIKSRANYPEVQAVVKEKKSRRQPLTQCFKRAKELNWLDKAGKGVQSITSSSKLPTIFARKHATPTQHTRVSQNLVSSIRQQSSRYFSRRKPT